MGVDVSETHGLDIVVMDDSLVPRVFRAQTLTELAHALERFAPDLVAIDSPPGWGTSGKSRLAERQLGGLGVSSYATPSDPAVFGRPFYGWMTKMGFPAFAVAGSAGYQRYREGDVTRSAIEVFPYATAVALAGYLPSGKPSGRDKLVWRTGVLALAGVDVRPLATIDLVDAGLAALTGVRALSGHRADVGDPREGVIVLPIDALPTSPWRQEIRPAA